MNKNKKVLFHAPILEFPPLDQPGGKVTFLEGNNHVPFAIKRVFYIYDVPKSGERGAHAHYSLHQILICLSGSYDVILDDGHSQKKIKLNQPWKGLYIPPMIWASEVNFDSGSVCMVLASHDYDEADYIREYNKFISITNSN